MILVAQVIWGVNCQKSGANELHEFKSTGDREAARVE